MSPQGRVDQVTVPGALRGHEGRLDGLEKTVGRWINVLPVAPADAPVTASGDDPLSPAFVNGWGNISGQQAVSFRRWPATKVQIRGALTGGALGTVAFALPDGYRPAKPTPIQFPAVDASVTYGGLIGTDGTVAILELLGVAGASGFASYTATLQPVPDGGDRTAEWTWDGSTGESDLFDLTDPSEPVARAAGLYAISVTARARGVTNDQAWGLTLDLNNGGVQGFAAATFPFLDDGSSDSPYGNVGCTWPIGAGNSWDAIIDQPSGVGNNDFDVYAYVVKLS